MHVAQDAQVFLSSAMVFAAHPAEKLRNFQAKSRKVRWDSSQFLRTARAQRFRKPRKHRRRVLHGVRGMKTCFCARSSRVARRFCTETVQFCGRKPRDSALEMLKISAITAADARRTPAKRSNNNFMHAAQAVQVFLSLPVFSAPKYAANLDDFRLKSRKFR